jgi:DNA-directed RNA polymerase subunit RPC12/RpoP
MLDLVCLTCACPLDEQALVDRGIAECRECGDKFLHDEDVLIYQDEIPHDEYLGG